MYLSQIIYQLMAVSLLTFFVFPLDIRPPRTASTPLRVGVRGAIRGREEWSVSGTPHCHSSLPRAFTNCIWGRGGVAFLCAHALMRWSPTAVAFVF